MKRISMPLGCTSLIAAALLVPSLSLAHEGRQGYGQDSDTRVLRDGFGNCVRTGIWESEMTLKDCGAESDSMMKKEPEPVPATTQAATPPAAPEPAPMPAAPEPAPVAPEPPPAPPKQAAAPEPTPEPTPKKQMMTVSAETLFGSGSAKIKPNGRAALDKLIGQIRADPFESVLVTGHADRTGTKTGNKRLSDRRAMAVKNYMVIKGIPANKMVAEGRGDSEPRTAPSDCAGLKKKKLAACLQPDRRVDIEVAR